MTGGADAGDRHQADRAGGGPTVGHDRRATPDRGPRAPRSEDLVVAAHEATIAPLDRRARGAHFTPAALADALVRWAVDGWIDPGAALRVLDPAVGGGSFLLAAARYQVATGAAASEVLAGLHGTDVDPPSISAARDAIRAWTVGEDVVDPGDGPHLSVADGLLAPPGGAEASAFDLVVGNPPFLGQMGTATRRSRPEARRLAQRYGPAARGYVDTAALFLLAALDRVRPGGRVVLVLPESVLGADHAAEVRSEVGQKARIVGLWVADAPVFAAQVDVCALCVERHHRGRGPGGGGVDPVRLAVGPDVRPSGTTAAPAPGEWARLLARARGVPSIPLEDSRDQTSSVGKVGDVADATAGFRQHHYGLVPHLLDHPEPGGDLHPVVTTGMVDPGVLGWGRRPARIGGRRWTHPAASLPAIEADDASIGAWFRARLGPKVLVAPQGRVVEAAVDPTGRTLPATPLVSVAPHPDAASALDVEADLVPWLILAALSAPPVSAWVVERSAGTGRGRDSVRVSGRTVAAVPLPSDRGGWAAAARRLRSGATVDAEAVALADSYAVAADHPVIAWWRERRPQPRS